MPRRSAEGTSATLRSLGGPRPRADGPGRGGRNRRLGCRRRLPLADLYDAKGDGIRRLTLGPGELLVAVHLPRAARGRRGRYKKLRVRPAYDFPELGVAVAGRWATGASRSCAWRSGAQSRVRGGSTR